MAKTILAPSLSERVYSGTHGNESVAEGVFTVNAAEQETVINLLSLPTGVRINGIQLISKVVLVVRRPSALNLASMSSLVTVVQ